MTDTTQTRFMLHEIGKRLGLPLLPIIDAIKATGLRGRMIGGTRYWTLAEIATLEQWIANKGE